MAKGADEPAAAVGVGVLRGGEEEGAALGEHGVDAAGGGDAFEVGGGHGEELVVGFAGPVLGLADGGEEAVGVAVQHEGDQAGAVGEDVANVVAGAVDAAADLVGFERGGALGGKDAGAEGGDAVHLAGVLVLVAVVGHGDGSRSVRAG